ncbi:MULTISPECIES: TIM-barrel domain-containing protein [Clostridium]|uniref:glycoside hydrolase family 31 protein n=1 Tax=Clostridium TaxID=1485 RepID=UPI000983973B|nr:MULTISPECIES: TIM-barrel domain-containing protein [Clostridium]AQR97326.1 alpha-xylosidase BoGH31A precursor [Clostridium saccharoperbutylacetonicum]NSB33209.1 alpha-glucosidase [Clostridium saccharoperbutylacetonicum]
MMISNKIIRLDNFEDYLEIATNAAKYRIILLNDDIVRIRCTFDEEFKDEASYALVMTAWEDKMDELLKNERTRVKAISTKYEDLGNYIVLATKNINVNIYKEPFGIEITDKQGNVLHSDLKEKAYVKDTLGRLYHYSCLEDEDYFYGFGEKAGYLNKKRRRMRMHNVDTIGYDSECTDPLYKHIPFYIKLNSKNNLASGIFYNNSYDSTFDMGCERSGYWNKYSYFCADGGELDTFFINGPQIKDVVKNYTDLTGKTAMPTKYSLGYMGSTMYYTELEEDSDKAILQFIDRCKEEGIPCDGFFMSSGYTTGEDGKRYVFNWNHDRFKNPGEFVSKLKEKGAALAPNIKPGMLISHPLYKEFDEAGAYIKDEKEENSQTDRYWGGQASFVDFTNPKGRELWKKHLKESLVSLGITSIWNDNNEYEINNTEAVCHFEGMKKEVSGLRPIMPNLMALMAKETVEEVYPNTRPYITNRAGFAGIQRYAQTWAGDNNTSWKSLKFNIPVILGLGLSGVANQGCDIGGFFGPVPEPELFVRWVQNGIFQPRFSIHSCNNDNTVTEPWMCPSYTKYIRNAIQLRYKLVPYYYSLLFEAATEGAPVMRPLIYEFPQDKKLLEESFDFMIGNSILVANVLEKGAKTRKVYLPEGATWFDWYTKQAYQGGQTIEVEVTLGSIPMFFRSGAIVPICEELMNIHKDSMDKLNILIEPSQESSFVLYEDDGTTNNYKNGEYLKTTISINNEAGIKVVFDKEGNYKTTVSEMLVNAFCKDIAPMQVRLENKKLKMFLDKKEWEASEEGWYYDMEQKTAKIKYKNIEENYVLYIDSDVKDLISI